MKKEKSEYLVLDLPEIDYESTEDRAILRWKYMWEEILIQYYWQTWHPCAYLKVKKIPKDIEMLDVPCNWWITFNNEITEEDEDTEWNWWRFTEWLWIGWDYAHCDDYMRILWRGKKWTTEEILKEIEEMIMYCKTKWML
jgi:hypothetical protein